MLRKPELSAGPMGHLSLYKGFTFTFKSIIAKITLYQLKTNVNARLTNKAASDALPRGHSEIPRITSITKTKTLSFSALNMSEHNASFERESLLKYQIFFQMVPLHRCRCRWKLLQTQVVFHQDTIDKYQ